MQGAGFAQVSALGDVIRVGLLRAVLCVAAAACGRIDDGPVFNIHHTIAMAAGADLEGAEAVTVIFLPDERITDSFPPQDGNVWYQEPLSLIDSGLESSQQLGSRSHRETQWRGYARLVPPRADETPIVGDIVDPVFEKESCEGEYCYRMNAHFELGRVTVP